jgi:hypothetical protein
VISKVKRNPILLLPALVVLFGVFVGIYALLRSPVEIAPSKSGVPPSFSPATASQNDALDLSKYREVRKPAMVPARESRPPRELITEPTKQEQVWAMKKVTVNGLVNNLVLAALEGHPKMCDSIIRKLKKYPELAAEALMKAMKRTKDEKVISVLENALQHIW